MKKKRKGGSIDNLEVVVLGLSHHNAKVEVREKLAIPEDQWNTVASQLCELDSIAEASVLSTCNRFEIYLAGANQYEVIKNVNHQILYFCYKTFHYVLFYILRLILHFYELFCVCFECMLTVRK